MDSASTTTTTNYVTALAPAFIAGFGVQQLVEILDSLLTSRNKWDPSSAQDVRKKKAILSCVSVAIAMLLVWCGQGQIDVLKPFLGDKYQWGLFGAFTTIIFISGGTEGFNSVMKWLNYKKEDAKATAAQSKSANNAAPGLKMMPS